MDEFENQQDLDTESWLRELDGEPDDDDLPDLVALRRRNREWETLDPLLREIGPPVALDRDQEAALVKLAQGYDPDLADGARTTLLQAHARFILQHAWRKAGLRRQRADSPGRKSSQRLVNDAFQAGVVGTSRP